MTSRLGSVIALCLSMSGALPALAQQDSGAEPMQRKATEASAERLLDDSLLSNPERRARAAAKLAEPEPESKDPDILAEAYFARGMAALDLGRQADALRALTRAGKNVAPGAGIRADIFYNLGQAQMNLGRVAPAIDSLREANKTTPQNNLILRNLALITEQYAKLGNAEGAASARDECMAMSRRAALDRSERNPTVATWRQANELRCQIAVAVAQGKLAEAEPLVRKVVAVYEDAPNTRGTYVVGNRHGQLAENLRQQGRLAEAENEARIALNIYQSSVGAASQRTGSGLVNLGRIIAEQGRLKEGEALARKGLEVMKGAGVSGKGGALGVLADILAAQYRWAEARAEYDLTRENFADDAEGLEAFVRQNSYYALALLKTGAADEALRLFQAALADFSQRLGEDHYTTAQARGFVGASLAALGRGDEALAAFARAVPVLIGGSGEEDEETGNIARDQKLRLILESYMDQTLKVRGNGPEPVAESFRVADAARGRSVQRALAASAVRAAAGNPALADLARRTQDAEKQIAALNGLLANAISARAEDQDADALATLKKRIATLRSERSDNLQAIVAKFPEYGRLLNPQPSTVAEIQAKLRPGEAMLAFYSADDRVYAWAVPASGDSKVAVAPIGRVKLEAIVKSLRQALDLSVNGIDEIPEFDLKAAWGLYAGLLLPTESAWNQAALVFTVPHGPLGQLPLAILPTAEPKPMGPAPKGAPLFARYREVPWLARKVAIAQLPSVGALTTLRALPERHAPRRTFIAFGDPLFSKEQAEEVASSGGGVTSRGVKRRSAPRSSPDFSAELAQLPRLPDTAEEVKSIAEVLHADPEQDIFLQARASEAQVRKLDLSKWRIVMFATHGLIPGDLVGLDQPALALSAPEVSHDGSSGLLTMERIMGLKLDADWVVLSACNTAAGDGAGAEAVSGLGRAFFYAGTRALLVSNWPVETVSARMLTTDLFRRQAADPTLARAQAMRQAMLGLVDGPGPQDGAGKEAFSYAHPTFWAPFSLVGDGGGGS
ncbi:MAG: CHAT domain-containing protein [Magnetospirillum sp.]|nr:CHAT domain-containing protein [Magnetospirillum sp.]